MIISCSTVRIWIKNWFLILMSLIKSIRISLHYKLINQPPTNSFWLTVIITNNIEIRQQAQQLHSKWTMSKQHQQYDGQSPNHRRHTRYVGLMPTFFMRCCTVGASATFTSRVSASSISCCRANARAIRVIRQRLRPSSSPPSDSAHS